MSELNDVLFELGSTAESEKLYKKALEIKRKTVGEKHLDYAVVLGGLALVYERTGRPDLAESAYKEAIQTIDPTFPLPKGHPYAAK